MVYAFSTATAEKLGKFAMRRHPVYEANSKHWEFLEATYIGGRSWFKENIFQYFKEGDTEYEGRIERAYRFNHTREVVDLVNKYVFKGEIARAEDAPDFIKKFWAASTYHKQPIKELMEAASRRASIFGRIWIVVDNNKPEEAISIADEKNSKSRIYAYTVKPTNVLDWHYDEDGELEWILIREVVRDSEDPLESSGKETNQYRLWTKNHSVLLREYDEEGKKSVRHEETREHNLGMVPVFAHDHIFTDEVDQAPALINDVAYLDRAVANYLSNLDAVIQDQTFSQLTIPAQAMMPDDDEYKQVIAMGTKRILVYNGESTRGPEYISPDPKQAQLIVSVITKIITEIYHSVGMAGERTKEDNAAGIDNSSGVAKAYDFERLNTMLAAKARSLELAEKQLIRIILAWHGQIMELEDVKDYVTYPKTFDVRSLHDEFAIAERLMAIKAPDLIRQEHLVRYIDKLWPQLSQDLRREIEKEIRENWPKDPVEEAQRMAEATGGVTDQSADAGKATPLPGKKNRQGENNKPVEKKV